MWLSMRQLLVRRHDIGVNQNNKFESLCMFGKKPKKALYLTFRSNSHVTVSSNECSRQPTLK